MSECIFCNLEPLREDILFETDNFFVKLGFGLTAPGHIMLVTKKHFACFADLPENLWQEGLDLMKEISKKIESEFGETYITENGIWGQSVFHAHMHFIPKIRKATYYYPSYKIKDVEKEILIPINAKYENADKAFLNSIRKENKSYVLFIDKEKIYYTDTKDQTVADSFIGYRKMFRDFLKIHDIPITWKNISAELKLIDDYKRAETKRLIVFNT